MKNPITNEMRENLLVTALEGGSNYWYFLKKKGMSYIEKHTPEMENEPLAMRMFKALERNVSIPIHDYETGDLLGEINMHSIEKAEEKLIEINPIEFANILTEDYDANTADIWFQLAVMGEIVFG